jgi:hypothetical protein
MPLNAAPDDVQTLACHDHVRVPDGRIGEVIGFYREEDEPMLVLFTSGDTRRYGRADLRLII